MAVRIVRGLQPSSTSTIAIASVCVPSSLIIHAARPRSRRGSAFPVNWSRRERSRSSSRARSSNSDFSSRCAFDPPAGMRRGKTPVHPLRLRRRRRTASSPRFRSIAIRSRTSRFRRAYDLAPARRRRSRGSTPERAQHLARAREDRRSPKVAQAVREREVAKLCP